MPIRTLSELFLQIAARDQPDCLLHKVDGQFVPISAAELAESVRRLAAALIAGGIESGDRIALLADNGPHWPIVDFATLSIGAVLVPIYPTLTAEQAAYIANDCGARYLFVEGRERLQALAEYAPDLAAVEKFVLIGKPGDEAAGAEILANLIEGGYEGKIVPINPSSQEILDLPCYPDLQTYGETVDLSIISIPTPVVKSAIQSSIQAGAKAIIVITAGFKEVGEEGAALERELALMCKNRGVVLLGPNCLGLIVPGSFMNVSFADGMPRKGHVAFISQSGALCTSVLDWAKEAKIGFSYFVSIGNAMDVTFGDLIDYFGQDPNTKSIVLYVESLVNARRFMSAARAFARKKPIIVYKSGRFPESGSGAMSRARRRARSGRRGRSPRRFACRDPRSDHPSRSRGPDRRC